MMLFVVIDHCNGHGIFGYEKMDFHGIWHSPFALLSVHVGGFVAISGWYGIVFSWKKVLSLYGMIVFYSVLGCIAWNVYETSSFSFKGINISGGWFGSNYLVLLFLTPFLNNCINCFNEKAKLLKAWGLLAFVCFLAWLPLGTVIGIAPLGVDEFSLFFMVFIYITARIAHNVFSNPIPLSKLIAAGLISLFIALIFLIIKRVFPVMGSIDMQFTRSRMAPYYYCLSIILLMFFIWHIRLPKWLGHICLFISPSLFPVYLIHDTTRIGHSLYLIPQKWLWANTTLHPFFIVLATSISTFCICLLIDMIRRYFLFVGNHLVTTTLRCQKFINR